MFDFLKRGEQVAEMTPEEAHRRQAAGEPLQIVDVREPQEVAEAQVEGAVFIPLGDLARRSGELRKDQPVVAMCRSGSRSKVAVSLLRRAGFEDVHNMTGGILRWTQRGLPTERGR
jgi:rhodanese-related sulfurtransferase